jgi:hypothetical protein
LIAPESRQDVAISGQARIAALANEIGVTAAQGQIA